jgi:hypothetical protein
MMNGYDMNGWGWFGLAMMVLVMMAIVGGVMWAITVRSSGDSRPRP